MTQKQQEEHRDHKERPEHHEELAKSTWKKQVRQNAVELRLQADIERQVEKVAQDGKAEKSKSRTAQCPPVQARSKRASCAQRQRCKPNVDWKVPCVEEGNPAQDNGIQNDAGTREPRRIAQISHPASEGGTQAPARIGGLRSGTRHRSTGSSRG